MNDKQDLATRAASEMQRQDNGAAHTQATFLRPPADIFEDADGITLCLDMPGVAKERLNIQTDKNTLTIDGDVQIAMAQGMEAVYAEVHSTHYRRSFTLSGELESDKTEANLKDGVLTLRIPKRAELRPRRIDVRAA
jgi:HSP20 family molecular chaperone IbpA